MKNTALAARILFAVPWLLFGFQHFYYAGFVTTLVPSYMPLPLAWAYFTGTAMLAAGISLLVNKMASLAAFLLGIMLLSFIFMIHLPKLAAEPNVLMGWTRALQDVSIMAAAFMLTRTLVKPEAENDLIKILAKASRYLFALLLVFFGIEQFMNLDFLVAKVPAYLPLRIVWVYLVGALMVLTGLSVVINKKARLMAISLGIVLLLINMLFHLPLIVGDMTIGAKWTAAMIDLVITGGVFILASTSSKD